MTFKHIASLALASVVALASVSGVAAATPAGETNEAVRPGAQPNIMGVWERYPSPFPEGLSDSEEIPAPGDGPDLKEPYASQWKAQRARRNAALKAGTPLVDPSTRCLPEGTPGIMQAIPLDTFSTPAREVDAAYALTRYYPCSGIFL